MLLQMFPGCVTGPRQRNSGRLVDALGGGFDNRGKCVGKSVASFPGGLLAAQRPPQQE